jgi:hypothetical protein
MENLPTTEQITKLQEQYGLKQMQDLINNGECWKFEGSYGRAAMNTLESGQCMLPEEQYQDYYGNTVPSRTELREGTKGTLLNCQRFWQKVLDGDIELEMDE